MSYGKLTQNNNPVISGADNNSLRDEVLLEKALEYAQTLAHKHMNPHTCAHTHVSMNTHIHACTHTHWHCKQKYKALFLHQVISRRNEHNHWNEWNDNELTDSSLEILFVSCGTHFHFFFFFLILCNRKSSRMSMTITQNSSTTIYAT